MPVASVRQSRRGEPIWSLAEQFPLQGEWTEDDYLDLDTSRLIEFDSGTIEVLPMPTMSHQLIILFLHGLFAQFFDAQSLGLTLVAIMKVKLWPGKYREPDILFMAKNHADRMHEDYWDGSDLVVEVVSHGKDSRLRDLRQKRRDYAKGRIPEYWIVDPEKQRIIVLKLRLGKYIEHGVFRLGEEAESAKWPDFRVSVDDVFAASKRR